MPAPTDQADTTQGGSDAVPEGKKVIKEGRWKEEQRNILGPPESLHHCTIVVHSTVQRLCLCSFLGGPIHVEGRMRVLMVGGAKRWMSVGSFQPVVT